MHCGVKGYAGVIWGQPEGNCPEMLEAIKCGQCCCSLRAEEINQQETKLPMFVIALIMPIGALAF